MKDSFYFKKAGRVLLAAVLTTAAFLPAKAQYLQQAGSFSSVLPQGGEVNTTTVKRDAAGNMYTAGIFIKTADFDPGPAVNNITAVGNSNIYFAKYDANGALVFVRQLVCTGANTPQLSLDASGNIVIAGVFYTSIDFDPGPGVQSASAVTWGDAYIAKYDANGDYMWSKTLGGTGSQEELIKGMTIDGAGNIIVAGAFSGTADMDPGAAVVNLTAAGANDAFFAKYDANGNYIFATPLGSTNWDQSYAVATDASNNIYLTGLYMGTVDFDPGTGVQNLVNTNTTYTDVFFAKYNSSGGFVWVKSITGPSNEMANAIAVDGSNNVYLAGQFTSTVDFDPGAGVVSFTTSSYDAFFAKYDANGNYVYAKQIGTVSGAEIAYGMVLDAAANIYITGLFNGSPDFDPGAGTVSLTSAGSHDIFLAKYTTAGNIVYARGMGGTNNDQGNSLCVDGSGNVYLAGVFTYTADLDPGAATATFSTGGNSSHNNAFIGKYSSTGAYVWASQIGTYSAAALDDKGFKIVRDINGNTYVAGTFLGTMDADPGPGTTLLTSAGSSDIFVSKYNASGALAYAFSIGGTVFETIGGIAVDASGNLYITGGYYDNADFDPGPGVQTFTNTNQTAAFFAKYNASGAYVFAKNIPGTGTTQGQGIALDGSGNIYITGYFSGNADMDPGAGVQTLSSPNGMYDNDLFLAKYDASGNYLWANRAGNTGTDQGRGIAVDGSGDIYLTGYYSGAVDFDPGAGTATLTAVAGNDIVLAKYNAAGNYVWAKSIGGTGTDQAYALALDGSGNSYLTGVFNGTADFDPGAATQNMTSAGSFDVFAAKYTSSGDYVYAQRLGGTGADYGYGIMTDASGNAYIGGSFSGTADFSAGGATRTLTSAGGQDAYMMKLDATGAAVYVKQIGGTGDDIVNGLFVQSDDEVYLTGSYAGTADFNMGRGMRGLSASNGTDAFMATFSNAAPLPLSLLEFGAKATAGGTVRSSWAIKPEHNQRFVVERSRDGRSFESAGEIAADGFSSAYSFDDTKPYTGTSYYRLKIVASGAQSSYSRTVAVNIDGMNAAFSVYPNPATDNAFLRISNSGEQVQVTVSVTDMSGKQALRQTASLTSGELRVPLQLNTASPGLLIISVSDDQGQLLWQDKIQKL